VSSTSITQNAHTESFILPEAVAAALGPPPIGSSEEHAAHELAMQMSAQALRPRSLLEWKCVRDLADHWLIIRRLRKVQYQLTEALMKATIEPQPRRLPSGEVVTLYPTLAACFGPYEQLDKLLAVPERRYENALKQFDELRHGLGDRLRQALDRVIEGECRPLEEAAA
jgi:hypothetical protein